MNHCPDHDEPFAGCEECAVAAAVEPWMQRFASLSDREHILPHPSIVWLKAQVMRSSADAARASRPMTILQMVAYLVVASGWATLLTWKWDAVQRMLHPFAAGGTRDTITIFATLLVLATMTVTLALHTILAEE